MISFTFPSPEGHICEGDYVPVLSWASKHTNHDPKKSMKYKIRDHLFTANLGLTLQVDIPPTVTAMEANSAP